MSRLDSAIRRLEAQRACLDMALGAVAGVPGVIFELGLGNGRTYDHLRERAGGREIFVFEREVRAHPDCIPDDAHLILGDLTATLPASVDRFAGRVALLHADIGTGDEAQSARLARALAPSVPALLAAGGIALSDQDLGFDGAEALAPPAGVQPGRYHLFRRP